MRLDDLDWTDGPEGTRLATRPTADELDRIVREEAWRHCRRRVVALADRLGEAFVEKGKAVEAMCWATATRLPMLLLGPWGTGKSALVRAFARGLGLLGDRPPPLAEATADGEPSPRRYFEYLVTRFTTPEELLGPVDVDALLRRSRHFRQTRGLLPQAEVAFLDEVFEANSAILNALLALLNEGLFHNAGRAWSTDLVVLFGASAAPPGDDLGAYYDRFPLRVPCDRVANTPDALTRLLARSHGQEYARQYPDEPTITPRVERLASLNDFRVLYHAGLRLFGGEQVETAESRAFLRTYLRVVAHLRGQFDVSDRACGQYYRLARTRALLADRTVPHPEDCAVLAYAGKDLEAARLLPEIIHDWIRAA